MDQILGLDELNRLVIAEGGCAGCGACVGRCPYLTVFKGKTVVLDRCSVENGRCFAHCPMTFFDPEATSLDVFGKPYSGDGLGCCSSVEGSRAADEAVAIQGQGGGTITALLTIALEKGIIDAAVLTGFAQGDSYPQGLVATTKEEILACAGSKFVGSHSLSALREAFERGFQRVGVVALPCQVRSLRKMALHDLKNEGYRDRIALILGLFCNWALNPRDLVTFLRDRFGEDKLRRMDIPPPPADVLVVETSCGVTEFPLGEVRWMIQKACTECPDMTSEFADLSVGMYEGQPGWNTLIVRTSKGKALVEYARSENRITCDPFPAENLEHLTTAATKKRQRNHRKVLEDVTHQS